MAKGGGGADQLQLREEAEDSERAKGERRTDRRGGCPHNM